MCLIECRDGDLVFFSDITRITICGLDDNWCFKLSTQNKNTRSSTKSFKSKDDALDWLQEVYDHQKDSYIYTID